jgi:hypothetical protein
LQGIRPFVVAGDPVFGGFGVEVRVGAEKVGFGQGLVVGGSQAARLAYSRLIDVEGNLTGLPGMKVVAVAV